MKKESVVLATRATDKHEREDTKPGREVVREDTNHGRLEGVFPLQYVPTRHGDR